jgi:hypothetical protein
MKHLKTLGVAVVAAAALMALVGAGTASATVICKNNLNTEKCSDPYASLRAGTSASLEAGGTLLATCTASIVKSTLANAGSSTTTVKSGVSSITWENCSQTIHTLSGGSAELHWISGTDNGTLITIGTSVTMGIFGTSCTYGTGAGTSMGTVKGGNPGSLKVDANVSRVAGGFLCPAIARFKGEYVATSPTNAWVAKG